MSLKPTQPSPFVLHIGDDYGAGGSIVAGLRQRGFSIKFCPDVYRALARLGAAHVERPAGLIVRVDALDPREVEFFEWARRLFHGLPIYVYTDSAQQPKIEMALRAGATGVVDAALAGKLAFPTEGSGLRVPAPADLRQGSGLRGQDATSPVMCSTDQNPGRKSGAVAEAMSSSVMQRASMDHAAKPLSDDAPRTTQPTPGAKVPWVPDPQRPQRRPPPQRNAEPSARRSSGAGLTTDRPIVDDAPLLTPEELAALMRDPDSESESSGRPPEGPRP
ncbi:MAG TPA: hypothetical protein VGM03_03745 [Phycisphaerae bacterium]